MRKFNLTLLTSTLCGFLALHAGEEEISSSHKLSQTEDVTENSDPSLACNDDDQSSSPKALSLKADEEEADVTSTAVTNNLASNESIEENEEGSAQTV